MPAVARDARVDRMLRPVHRWVWGDFDRRVRKLLAFAEVEGDGGRDILRAAEVTSDPLLRRLYLEHAIDEFRHGVLFRHRAAELLKISASRSSPGFHGDWLAPGGHGLDDLQVDGESDRNMLAFLHLSENAADNSVLRLIAAIRLAGQACRAPGTFGMDDGLAWTQ